MSDSSHTNEQQAQPDNRKAVVQNRSKNILVDNRNIDAGKKTTGKPPVQRNKTGLPDNLKSGMETLSGVSLDHVRVHYNSAKPAAVQAHAYAQGNEIHLASGQERHLPHELGHVVQQMQGRVKPTMSFAGTQINDDPGLEQEATVMGERALQRAGKNDLNSWINARAAKPQALNTNSTAQFKSMDNMGMEGIDYAVMSQKSYGRWQKTLQAKNMSGVCRYGDQVIVAQFRRPQDIQQYFRLSANWKGGLLIAEGILALAAGIAAILITHGVGLIPGIAALAVGVTKIVRGIVTIRAGEEPSGKEKAVMDALRTFEAAAAIVGASAVGLNIPALVFGVAKALRSLLTALADYINKDNHPLIHKAATRLAGALHVVEVGAGFAIGGFGVAGAVGATSALETGSKVTGAIANSGIATSKGFRAWDQNDRAWKTTDPQQQPLLPNQEV